MFSLKDIKEKLSKEKPVETFDSIYTDKSYKFTVKINESSIMQYLYYVTEEHNKKNPDKEIEASDVVKTIVEKALLEHSMFYKYNKSYEDLVEESSWIRVANYKNYYYDSNLVPIATENKELKAEVKAVNNTKKMFLEENNKLKSELESIRKIVNK